MTPPSHINRSIRPKVGLLIVSRLGASLASLPDRRRQGQEGFSMALVIIVVLTVILGTLAVAGRSGFGLLGSAFQVQSREARAAAEIGANWTISEMNKVQNRTLLVTAAQVNETDPSVEPHVRWPNAGAIPNNPCSATPPTLANLDPNTATTNQFEEWFVLPNGVIQATAPGGNFRSFRIIGVARPSQLGNPATKAFGLKLYTNRNFADLANSGTQPLFLRIEGRSYRNGVVVSRTVLEKEYEVVPKCCGRTFGSAHGNDVYTNDNKLGNDPAGNPLEAYVCVPPIALGYGLVAGVGPGTGSVDLKGNPTITTGTTPIDPIICLVDDASKCTYSTKGSGTPSVSLVNGNLGLPQTFQEATGVTVTPLELQNCTSATNCPSNSAGTIGSPAVNTFTSFDSTTNTTYVNVASVTAANLPPNCRLSADDKTVHCNVTKLTPNANTNFEFRTSVDRSIRLYFPNSGEIIATSGNASIRNLRCDPANPTNCTQPALSDDPPYPVTTLSMYGCVASGCGPQNINLNGTPNTLFMFGWFPYGVVDYRGTSDLAGILWTESLSLSGTPTFTVPGSGLGDVLCQLGAISCVSNPNPTNNPIFFDQIARATNRFRFIGN